MAAFRTCVFSARACALEPVLYWRVSVLVRIGGLAWRVRFWLVRVEVRGGAKNCNDWTCIGRLLEPRSRAPRAARLFAKCFLTLELLEGGTKNATFGLVFFSRHSPTPLPLTLPSAHFLSLFSAVIFRQVCFLQFNLCLGVVSGLFGGALWRG